jgi:hypothetical protein
VISDLAAVRPRDSSPHADERASGLRGYARDPEVPMSVRVGARRRSRLGADLVAHRREFSSAARWDFVR